MNVNVARRVCKYELIGGISSMPMPTPAKKRRDG